MATTTTTPDTHQGWIIVRDGMYSVADKKVFQSLLSEPILTKVLKMFCRSGLSIPSRSSACTESSCACTKFFRVRRRKVKKRKRHRSSHPISKSRKNDANDCIGNPFTISENIVIHHTPQPPHHLTQHLTPPPPTSPPTWIALSSSVSSSSDDGRASYATWLASSAQVFPD